MVILASEALSSAFPNVDVVILSWNRIDMTIETIENVLAQKGVEISIYIVDQGSDSKNLKKLSSHISKYPNVYLKALEGNVGVPRGRNIGLEMGESEFTVSIDNDAIFCHENSLAKVVDIFESEPDIGVIGFRIKNFYTSQDEERNWVYPKSRKSEREGRFTTTRFSGCGHAIRRSAFDKAGGYDSELFFYWEETDLSFRIINCNYQIIYEPEVIVLHKLSPEARVRWDNNRFYFHVRNAIYMNLKYNKNKFQTFVLSIGYLAKGTYNALINQSLRGIFDGFLMYIRLLPKLSKEKDILKLNKTAEAYIYEHDVKYRGSFLDRLKTEVFVTLAGHKRA